ncbi:MAG: hypothetical protein ACQEQ4_00670 [Fibrobacterota bacterium]
MKFFRSSTAFSVPCVFALFVCAVGFLYTLGAEQLYIYYPSPEVRPGVVQQTVQEVVNDVDITVFGVYRDFAMKVEEDRPRTVLGPRETVQTLSHLGYQVALRACENNDTASEYVLLSLEQAFSKEDMDSTTVIGVVDIMERTDMKDYVFDLLRTEVRVNHVTKMEDLLPLLIFNMADAILIPRTRKAYFDRVSNQEYYITPLGKKPGIAQLAAINGYGKSAEVIEVLMREFPDYIMEGIIWK